MGNIHVPSIQRAAKRLHLPEVLLTTDMLCCQVSFPAPNTPISGTGMPVWVFLSLRLKNSSLSVLQLQWPEDFSFAVCR